MTKRNRSLSRRSRRSFGELGEPRSGGFVSTGIGSTLLGGVTGLVGGYVIFKACLYLVNVINVSAHRVVTAEPDVSDPYVLFNGLTLLAGPTIGGAFVGRKVVQHYSGSALAGTIGGLVGGTVALVGEYVGWSGIRTNN